MDDLLNQFEALLDEYQRAVTASNGDREAYAIMRSHNAIQDAARDVVDFLIDHDATVTFAAPSAPEPWQVTRRPDLTANTWEVRRPDENYTVDKIVGQVRPGTLIYHCGCGRYLCEHIDAVLAFEQTQQPAPSAPEFDPHANHEWRDGDQGVKWYRKDQKQETDEV